MNAHVRPATLPLDLKPRAAREAFARARRAEVQYSRQLRVLARHIGDLIGGTWNPDDPQTVDAVNEALGRYAKAINPWAQAAAKSMVAEVAARDRKAWTSTAREMGQLIGRELDDTPTGALFYARMADQVNLITSLPIEAGERVHRLTTEALTTGRRAHEIAGEIMRSGDVTRSRANLIARTEVGRTAAEFQRARAEQVGVTHFIWRTVGDSDVRKTHRRLNGKPFAFNDPPECDPGHHALPGAIFNCRCYADPIIPEFE